MIDGAVDAVITRGVVRFVTQGMAGVGDTAAGARAQLLAATAEAALDGSAPPVAAHFLTALAQRAAPDVLRARPVNRVCLRMRP